MMTNLNWFSIIGEITPLLQLGGWLLVAVIALRKERFLGSWLFLGGASLGLVKWLAYLSHHLWGALYYEIIYGIASWMDLIALILIVSGVVLWIGRAASLQRRVHELEGIVQSMSQR